MRWKLGLGEFLTVTVLAACATPKIEYGARSGVGQLSKCLAGSPVIYSVGLRSSVLMGPANAVEHPSQPQDFTIVVANTWDRAFDFGPAQFDITTDAGTMKLMLSDRMDSVAGKTVATKEFEAGVSVASNQRVTNATEGARDSAVHCVAAGRSSSGIENERPDGSARRATSAAAANLGDERTGQRLTAGQQEDDITFDKHTFSDGSSFREQTILPGASLSTGVTMSRLPLGATEIIVKVFIAGEEHALLWDLSRPER